MEKCVCSEQVRKAWGTHENTSGIHLCAFCDKPAPNQQAELDKERREFETARRAAELHTAEAAEAVRISREKQRTREVEIYGEDQIAEFEERLKAELKELDYQNWRRGRIPHVKNPEKREQLTQLSTVALGTMMGTGIMRTQLSHIEESLDSGSDSTDSEGFLDNLF